MACGGTAVITQDYGVSESKVNSSGGSFTESNRHFLAILRYAFCATCLDQLAGKASKKKSGTNPLVSIIVGVVALIVAIAMAQISSLVSIVMVFFVIGAVVSAIRDRIGGNKDQGVKNDKYASWRNHGYPNDEGYELCYYLDFNTTLGQTLVNGVNAEWLIAQGVPIYQVMQHPEATVPVVQRKPGFHRGYVSMDHFDDDCKEMIELEPPAWVKPIYLALTRPS